MIDSYSLMVSVIILGYNGLRFLDNCLNSVLDQDLNHRYEVIYVDNGSTDDSANYVRETFPEVKTISLGQNLGFAGGNNEAVQYAKGRYLTFLNQDMIVHRSWLRTMLETMASNSQLGACHANMLMPWHKEFATLDRTQYPRRVYVTDINRRYGFTEYRQLPMQSSPIPTLFLSGGCFLINRPVLHQLLYLFDKRFFMYAEDVDLALRINALGYTIVLAPRAVVYHLHEPPSSLGIRELRNAYLATRNRILAYYKTTTPGEFLSLLPRLVFGAPIKVFEGGQKRLLQLVALLAMLPVTFVAMMAAFAMMPSYAAEREYWELRRTSIKAQQRQNIL